jgi:hypothetical protein
MTFFKISQIKLNENVGQLKREQKNKFQKEDVKLYLSVLAIAVLTLKEFYLLGCNAV